MIFLPLSLIHPVLLLISPFTMAEIKTTAEKTVVQKLRFTDNIIHNENGVCHLCNIFVLTYDYGTEIENARVRLHDAYNSNSESHNSVQPPIVFAHLDFEARYPRYVINSYRVLNRGCLCHICDVNGPNLFTMNRSENVGRVQESHNVSVGSRRTFEG
jgi:hypothetical protein